MDRELLSKSGGMMETEHEELSCDLFSQQIKAKKRIAVTFAAKEFPGTESYLEALGQAFENGFFGEMEMAIIPVESQECDQLAEQEKVDRLPQTCVYSFGKRVACVTPSDEDARVGYRKTVEKLIDLSED